VRLRYLQLQNYPPIKDTSVCFASGSPLERECAIRFIVGPNGSGKSNLLRAVAEVFLALTDQRLPPFPVTLVYELGLRGSSSHYTFVLDCPGTKAGAAMWVAEGWHWPDDADKETFAAAIGKLRDGGEFETFRYHIARSTWPQEASIALPQAVLAYTTGDMRPWRSIWSRDQDAEGVTFTEGINADSDERPAGWTSAQENALIAARQGSASSSSAPRAQPTSLTASYRRPILLDPTLLKCALLAVALPQAFIETTDYPLRADVDAVMAKFRGRADNRNAVQELLERGGWHHLVSVVFRCHLQTNSWDSNLRETAHDWLLCAGEIIAEPHPTEMRRMLFFDLKGQFRPSDLPVRQPNDWLATSTTQGEALWALLGGVSESTFGLFIKLLELNRAGLFDEVLLRLRRTSTPNLSTGFGDDREDVGVLRYEELSDGEQMILGRMALFHLLQNQNDVLLLLDEPETHFNDKWKREIVDIIDDAIANTANDVLISTHSAIVLSDVFNDEIVMIEARESGSTAIDVPQKTFGGDPGELMIRVFGASDSTGKRAQTFIEETIRNATGSQQDIARVRALVARMGPGFYRSELQTLLNKWAART
jgi:predicted ATPase